MKKDYLNKTMTALDTKAAVAQSGKKISGRICPLCSQDGAVEKIEKSGVRFVSCTKANCGYIARYDSTGKLY